MSTSFFFRRIVSLCAFIGCMQSGTTGYALVKSEPPGASVKEEAPTATYSKAGSDSISLIIFGRVLVKTAPTKGAGSESTITTTTPSADKNKKKDKFSIKSTDKLKTNNPLY